MYSESKIVEWKEKPWNPASSCEKISTGCANCYAEKTAKWLQRMNKPGYAVGFKLTLKEDLLDEPKKWKTPKRVFLCSMSDIFHKDIPDEFI